MEATTDEGRASLARLAAPSNHGDPVIERETMAAFAPGGALDRAGLQVRAPQVEMAACVARRIDKQDGWAGVEAATGTGKSIGYLLPGILAVARAAIVSPGVSRPVVVSTSSITLQAQLQKDVPLVGKLLGLDVTVAARKGISNYACLMRLDEVRMGLGGRGEALSRGRGEALSRIAALVAAGTWSGDRDELPFDPGWSWSDASVSRDECVGDRCKHHKSGACFAVEARRRAAAADVQVVNHHWLAAAGGVHGADPVLLAVDEAHELEDSVRAARTERLSAGTLRDACRVAARLLPGEVADRMKAAVGSVINRADAFVSGPRAVQLQPGWAGQVATDAAETLRNAANAIKTYGDLETDEDAKLRAQTAAKQVNVVVGRIVRLAQAEALVVMAERETGRQTTLRGVAVDAAPSVEALRRKFPAGVACSATLAAGGKLDHLAAAGIHLAEGRVLPSPFPLATQGLLVVPALPLPKDPAWQSAAVRAAVEAVDAAGGRSLVLCSSWAMVGRVADALQAAMPAYRVRRQGDAGRSELTEWFRRDVSGVLVASRSFSTGLDIPGESLSCVVIDRVPFASPDDPVEREVAKLAAERLKKSEFLARSLPQAAMALAQGAGRLIRTATDRGVLVVLDGRVTERSGMGSILRAALPPFPVSTSIADIAPFLAGRPIHASATPTPAPLVEVAPEEIGGTVRRRRAAAPTGPSAG